MKLLEIIEFNEICIAKFIIIIIYYYLFILITQARLCFRMMAVISLSGPAFRMSTSDFSRAQC